MKVGVGSVGLGPFSSPEAMGHLAQTAERCGFESVWAPDHSAIPDPHQSKCPYTPDGEIPGGPHAPLCEPITALSYVAGADLEDQAGHRDHDSASAPSVLRRQGTGDSGPGVERAAPSWESAADGARRSSRRWDLTSTSAASAPTRRCRQYAPCGARTRPPSRAPISISSGFAAFPSRCKRAAYRLSLAAIRAPRPAARHASATAFYPLTPIVGTDVEDHRLPPGDQGTDRAAQGGMRQGRTQLRRLRHLDRSGARSRHDQAPRRPRRNARVHELRCHRSRRGDPLGGASRQ